MNVTAEAVTSKVISVQWDVLRACSHINDLLLNFKVQYSVECSDDTGNISNTKQLNATQTQTQLTGIKPYTNCSIKVAAVNEMGDVGPYSYPVTTQTPESSNIDNNGNILISIIFFPLVPGPVGAIMASPSQSQVSLSWDPPLMPNGIIIAYEVSYRPTASSEPETRVNTTTLVTHFTTEDNLEEDTEFFFSVRAYTRVGPGNTSSLTVSTLPQKSEIYLQESAHYLPCLVFISGITKNTFYFYVGIPSIISLVALVLIIFTLAYICR